MTPTAVKCAAFFGRASLVFLFMCFRLSDRRTAFSDQDKLFYDLVSGTGLYATSDLVTVLDNNNFNSSVIECPQQAWVVEFYNSWCGHCIRYSSTWKSLARNIYNWRDIIRVAVVDCSLENNGQLCRDYEVMAYPTLRYFPPNSPPGYYGDDMRHILSIDNLRHHIIEAIEDTAFDNKGAASWPNLKDTTNLTESLSQLSPEIEYIAVMFDNLTSFAGVELILDFHTVKELKVLSVLKTSEEYVTKFDIKEFPSLYVQPRGLPQLNLLPVKDKTRVEFFNALKMFLNEQGIHVPEMECSKEAMIDPSLIFNSSSDEKALSDDKVYQLDLEMALRYTLFREVRGRKVFEGETLVALQKFVRVMTRYFPLNPVCKELLQKFNNAIWEHEGALTIDQYNEYIQPFESQVDQYLLSPSGYVNCAQSIGKPPCSMWLLFHMLTVQASIKHLEYDDLEPQDVLNSITGYVKYFFGCSECSKHFQAMAESISEYVDSFDKSILWLWKAHNQANARLNDASAPGRPKIQFPSEINCPTCRFHNDWNKEQVLNHLNNIYTNISCQPLVKQNEV